MKEIVRHLTRLGRRTPKLLNPGLSREAIARATAKLPFALPPEVVALYEAFDGTRTDTKALLRDMWLFPGYILLSLEDAVEAYRLMRRARGWKPSWFPVFADDAGSYYAVACEKSARARGVVGFLHGEPDPEVEYGSLETMLATIAACLAKGAFYSKGKDFEIDDVKHAAIARLLNPGVPFWVEADERAAQDERDERASQLESEGYRLLTKQRKPHEALAAYEEAMDLGDQGPSFYVNALFALNSANAKKKLDPSRMRRMVERVLARKRLHGDTYWNAACTWIVLGEVDECIACLRSAKKRGADMKKVLADRDFKPLANDPRFLALKRASSR
jgi:cell wall assembly regulator SMI1